jgi:hypothetical protein
VIDAGDDAMTTVHDVERDDRVELRYAATSFMVHPSTNRWANEQVEEFFAEDG